LLLVLVLITDIAFGAAGTFPQGDHLKMLKNKIEGKGGLQQVIFNDSQDPTVVAKSADAGSLFLGVNGDLWIKKDGGSSTNWVETLLNGEANLDDLLDVVESGAAEGHVIEYDDTTSKYVNRMPWSKQFYNGAVKSSFDVTIASTAEAGGDCTAAGEGDPCLKLTLEKSGGGDLEYIMNGIENTYDTTPAVSYVLTAGTDTVPVTNFVWVEWTGAAFQIDSSTSDFPSGQWYSPVGVYVLRSVATTDTTGVFSWQNYTDHISNSVGHLTDINDKIRQGYPQYFSGSALTPNITINGGAADNVDVSIAAGVVYQLHQQTTAALDSSTGDDFHIVNDNVTAYKTTADLNTELTDATGSSMSGKKFSLVIWGIASKTGVGANHIMVNLPNCTYNAVSTAITDANGCSVYTIPTAFKRTGYLIAKLTFAHSAAASGTWTVEENESLLGQIPSTAAGGGTSGGAVEFPDSVFRIQDDGDPTKEISFQASGITTGNVRELTVPDSDGTLAYATGLSGGQTIYGGTAGGNDLTLSSTSDATKGDILIDSNIIADGHISMGDELLLTSVDADTFTITPGTAALYTILTDTSGGIALNTTDTSVIGTLTVGGVASFNEGTVAAPGIAFGADPDSGLYRIGANNIGIATNGTLALDIDANQDATLAGDLVVGGGATVDQKVTSRNMNNDIFYFIDNDTVEIGEWDATNLSTHLFTSEASAVISGAASYEIANITAGSGYVESPEIAVDPRSTGKPVSYTHLRAPRD